MADSLPETEQINELGSNFFFYYLQVGSKSAGYSQQHEGLLPAGPEAEITFCCAETAGAESWLQPAAALRMPPSVPLGTVSVLGRHRWGEAALLLQCGEVAQSTHRPNSAASAPSLLCNLWRSVGR